MKNRIGYVVLALFAIAMLLFLVALIGGGMELSVSPLLEFLGFIGFLAAFFAAAFGIKKAIDYITHKRAKHTAFPEDIP